MVTPLVVMMVAPVVAQIAVMARGVLEKVALARDAVKELTHDLAVPLAAFLLVLIFPERRAPIDLSPTDPNLIDLSVMIAQAQMSASSEKNGFNERIGLRGMIARVAKVIPVVKIGRKEMLDLLEMAVR
jgi:hypothetical protein